MDTHDERRIPLDLPEPDTGLLSVLRAGIARLLGRRKAQETRQQAVRVSNLALREAQARRALSQPGVSPEATEKALRVFSRVGSGSGTAKRVVRFGGSES